MADSRTYNARVTTEALEKKFRDTFPSQAGAELVDDLYASGVVVPIVDFTAAAQGSELPRELQQAWDFATGIATIEAGATTLISTPGFWKVGGTLNVANSTTSSPGDTFLFLDDGASLKRIWRHTQDSTGVSELDLINIPEFVVYVRTGETFKGLSPNNFSILNVWYRQIADVYGNLTNPLGFTSS